MRIERPDDLILKAVVAKLVKLSAMTGLLLGEQVRYFGF